MFRECEYGRFGVGLLWCGKLVAYIDADEVCYITQFAEKWMMTRIAKFADWYDVPMQDE